MPLGGPFEISPEAFPFRANAARLRPKYTGRRGGEFARHS